MAVFAGLRGSGNWGTDERPTNFRESIMFMNPEGTAPIFALTSKMPKMVTDDIKHSWWAEPQTILRLTNTAQSTANLGATGLDHPVTADDPDAADITTPYSSADNVIAGDLFQVESDAATYSPWILRATEDGADGTAGAVKLAIHSRGATGNYKVPAGAKLFHIGNVFAEGTTSPDSATRNPVQYHNICQIFKTTYQVTNTAKEIYARTGNVVANDKKRKMFDHARSIETAILFGHKEPATLAIDAGTSTLRTMGGLREFTKGHVFTSGAKMSYTTLLDAVSPVFDWDSPAGDTRLAFCGNGALNSINKMIAASGAGSRTELQFGGREKTYGINFRELILPQGRLMLKTHPLLSRNGLYTNSMFIIDASCLRWVPLKNRDTKFKDNIQANDADLIKGQWLTEATIRVDMGGVTCKYLGGMNNI